MKYKTIVNQKGEIQNLPDTESITGAKITLDMEIIPTKHRDKSGVHTLGHEAEHVRVLKDLGLVGWENNEIVHGPLDIKGTGEVEGAKLAAEEKSISEEAALLWVKEMIEELR